MRRAVSSPQAPEPKGIYSPAIVTSGTYVFVSGQGPIDPATGEFVLGSFREQAELTFRNVGALVEAAGSSWENVVKVSVFLADIRDFAEMNEIYQRFFKLPYPARTTVQAGLGKIAIEVDCIALVSED